MWVFAPGNTQGGDGIFRNPIDDIVREGAEDKGHMPKTLAEASEAATGTSINGVELSDNAFQYTQQFVNNMATSINHAVTDLDIP